MNFIFYLAVIIVSSFIQAALAPKPPSPRPAAIEDFDVPTAEQGRPLPVIFGTVLVTGPNVLWYGDLGAVPIRVKSGKK